MSKFVLTAQLQLQAPTNVGAVVQQIQNQLNGINVNLNVQGAAKAQQQIQQVTKATNAATNAAERMGTTFAVSIRRFAAFSIATRAVGLFTSTLSDAISTAINFERQLIKVSQVTGKSMSELRGLTDEITRLSTSLGVSSDSLLEVSTILSQAGLSANDTATALNTLAKAALAPNFDSITETAEGAIAILAQFKQGVGALESQLGSINAVAGAFAVEASDLIDVIRRTGGVFKASGGDLNELLALFTSVRATTRESAESIGTGLRTIFTRIQRPKTIEFLKQFGVELVDLNGKFVGPYEAVKRLSEALSGLGEGDIGFIRIAEELGGFRQIGKVLPLLQQFATAEAALNVATSANNSLSKDAASAQAALAIRILKVKEEFLSLIRGMTETTAFQIMANTALNLASALIKLADSLKPILPLLTAVAAVKIASGLGSFIGGFGKGAASGRTFNQGGRVYKFATGGLVPGSGNSDTVPAMLSPGEFVIRKSSVAKLGADNLAHMNTGGAVQKFAFGGKSVIPRSGIPSKKYIASLTEEDLSQLRTNPSLARAGTSRIDAELLKRRKGFEDKTKLANVPKFGLVGLFGNNYGPILGTTPNTKTQVSIQGARLNKKESKQYEGIMKSGFIDTIKTIAAKLSSGIGAKPTLDQGFINDVIKKSGFYNAAGAYLESTLALVGAPFDKDSINSPIDFPSGLGSVAGKFGILSNIPTDVTRTIGSAGKNNAKFLQQIDRYLIKNGLAQQPIKRATGGGVGTDTVPALLTPGEFVVNKSSAQRIGYGNLNRMNKIGKYAKGGIVSDPQRFFVGGVAEKQTDRLNFRQLTGIDDAKQEMSNILKDLGDSIKSSILQNFKGIEAVKPGEKSSNFNVGFGEGVRGKAMWNQKGETGIGLQMGKANTNTIAHETGHLADLSLGGKKGLSSQTKGTFQFDLVEKVKPQMEAAFKAAGNNANDIKQYLANNAELFAEFFAKASPEVRAIITSTTDSKKGMQALQQHLQKAGNTYAGLEASDINVPKTSPTSTAATGGLGYPGSLPISPQNQPQVKQTQAQKMGMSTSQVLAAAKAQSQATTPSGGFATMGGFMGNKAGGGGGGGGGGGSGNTPGGSNNSGNSNASGMQKFSMGITLATAALQSFLPPLNENSGVATKVAHSLLSMATAIGGAIFALESMGVSLKSAAIIDFFKGKGMGTSGSIINKTASYARAGTAGIGNMLQSTKLPVISSIGNIFSKMAPVLGNVVGGLATMAGPLLAVGAGIYVVGNIISSMRDLDGQLKKAIESEDVVAAKNIAVSKAAEDAIGGLGGWLASLVGAEESVVSFMAMFGGPSVASIQSNITAQIQSAKTQKELSKSAEAATRAMEDFEKGNISAYEALKASSSGAKSVEQLKLANEQANKDNTAQKSTGDYAVARNVFTLGGMLGENAGTRNARIDSENKKRTEETQKSEKEIYQQSKPALSAFARDLANSGGSLDDFQKKITESMGASFVATNYDEIQRTFENISKEVKRTQEAFKAMNVGLQAVNGAANAAVLGLNNYLDSQEFGNNAISQSIATLEASITGAAQGISDADFGAAIGDAENALRKFGADEGQISKFKENLSAINNVQKNAPSIFEAAQAKLKEQSTRLGAGKLSSENKKNVFIDEAVKGLGDVGPEIKDRLRKTLEAAKIDTEALDRGDFSVFEDAIKQAGDATLKQAMDTLKAQQEVNAKLIAITTKRIELENEAALAEKNAISVRMEAREIEAKYGGRSFTAQDRAQGIVSQANKTQVAGISDLKTGSAAEISNRTKEISSRRQEIEGIRARAAQRDKNAQSQLSGPAGKRLEAESKRLDDLAKEQINTTKELIKSKEDELKVVKEKTKLEKDSIDALINGDITKFFDQQAAIGAQAAVATGNQQLANQFGTSALGAAAQETKRQQEAGVQELYGRKLAGPGGLTEATYGSALSSTGIQNPLAMARVAAGTTPEEAVLESDIRDLAATLGPTADLQSEAANLQLAAAQLQYEAVQKIPEKSVSQVKERQGVGAGAEEAVGKALGGLIYANRGIFVPRGTDTVPAMLTPGEFVVNRAAVQRGNNLQILQAMNRGSNSAGVANQSSEIATMARGGVVRYRANGSNNPEAAGGGIGLNPEVMNKFASALSQFNEDLSKNITALANTKFDIQLAPTNINVNLTGTSFLETLKGNIISEIFKLVSAQLFDKASVGSDGSVKKNNSVLPPVTGK